MARTRALRCSTAAIDVARRSAHAAFTAPGNVGAIAFSRTGDLDTGDFADPVIAQFGEVDTDALAE